MSPDPSPQGIVVLAIYEIVQLVFEETLTETAPSAESEAISAEARGALYKRLHALPEPYREVLYLRLLADLSYNEIGNIFGKTENWARVTFYRGKEKLKEQEDDEE